MPKRASTRCEPPGQVIAGRPGEQGIQRPIVGNRDLGIVLQAIDPRDLERDAVERLLRTPFGRNDAELAFLAIIANTADDPEQLVVDALATVIAFEIFGRDLAVEVDAQRVLAGRFVERELVRLGVGRPDFRFALELRFRQRAFLAVLRKLLGELFARPDVETVRALLLVIGGLAHTPRNLVGQHVADPPARRRRVGLGSLHGRGAGEHG